MPGPEDYVDAPKGSLRAKLERDRKGSSKYDAIPKGYMKDPVGSTALLMAAFGAPELKQGVQATKAVTKVAKDEGKSIGDMVKGSQINPDTAKPYTISERLAYGKAPLKDRADFERVSRGSAANGAPSANVVASGEKAGGIANKITRFGRHDDPTTQLAQGGATLKTGLDEAQKAGEQKAMSKKPKVPGMKKGGVVKGAMTGALIQSGFDTMLGNGDTKTKPSWSTLPTAEGTAPAQSSIAPLVPPPPAVPAFNPTGGGAGGGGGVGELAMFATGKSSVVPTLGASGSGGGGLVPAKNKGTWDAMSSYADGGVIGNPHPNKSAGHIARGLHGMANGGFITMKGARKGSKGVGGKRMPKKGVMA